MSILGWAAVLAYPVGNWLLWHRVELERTPAPDDYGDPESLSIRRPSRDALTAEGWKRWHLARRFTITGFLVWLVASLVWLVS